MKVFQALCLVVLVTVSTVLADQDEEFSVTLWHSIKANGDDSSFVPRGRIYINIARLLNSARYEQENALTNHEISQLSTLSKDSKHVYRVRVQSNFGSATTATSEKDYVIGFTKACLLVEANLAEIITLSVYPTSKRILSISLHPVVSSPTCDIAVEDRSLSTDKFNTTVLLIDTVDGPAPETQAYLQKLEKERQEKETGDQGDNRSFIAKYWIYIVPVAIFVMVSGALNPEAQAR